MAVSKRTQDWKINRMFLKRKIKSSSIAEVVVALAILAICFGIASLIFVRSTNSASKFMDIKKQTNVQNVLMEHLENDIKLDFENLLDDLTFEMQHDELNDSLEVINFYGSDQRLIWTSQQQK